VAVELVSHKCPSIRSTALLEGSAGKARTPPR
jgi:hypothetical protein